MESFLLRLAEQGGPTVVISIVILLILKVVMKKQFFTANGQGARIIQSLDRLAASAEKQADTLYGIREDSRIAAERQAQAKEVIDAVYDRTLTIDTRTGRMASDQESEKRTRAEVTRTTHAKLDDLLKAKKR